MSDPEQETNKTQNAMRGVCPILDKYVKAAVQCGYCERWFHFKCKNTTEKQVSKAYPAEKQYICMQYQNKTFESTLLLIQYQKTEEIRELKQKYENAK